MIHLDTNYLIGAGRPASPEADQVLRWLKEGVPLAMSAIAWAEFLCGPHHGNEVSIARRMVPKIVPLERPEAVLAARLFNVSGRRRGKLHDCAIAATAIRANARLATSNRQDFRRMLRAGLQLV